MKSPFTHILFDLDGTLLDSEPLYSIAAERVCERYGATFTLALKRAIMGGDTQRGAELVVRTLGLPLTADEYVEARAQELSALWPTLAPMPHAEALIGGLRRRGIPMALATSGHRAVTEEKLAYHPFLAEIPVRVCGDDPRLQHGKPAPDIFLLAAHELSAEPARCVVVEDSQLGVEAGVAANCHTIALVDARYGFEPRAFSAASQIIGALSEIDVEALFGPAPKP